MMCLHTLNRNGIVRFTAVCRTGGARSNPTSLRARSRVAADRERKRKTRRNKRDSRSIVGRYRRLPLLNRYTHRIRPVLPVCLSSEHTAGRKITALPLLHGTN